MRAVSESLSFMTQIAQDAGALLLQYYKKPVRTLYKEGGDFATQADIESQQLIVSAIEEAFPEDGIISEEDHTKTARSAYTWIIDPLDGTKNYMHGSPHFAVMIARADSTDILESVIYFPTDNVMLRAQKNQGAWLNDERVYSSFEGELSSVRACLAHVSPEAHTTPAIAAVRAQFSESPEASCTLFSSAANTRSVLEGHHDIFIVASNCVWDNSAPALLLSEAGLRVTDWHGGAIHPRYGTQHFLAAPHAIHTALQHTLITHLT